MLSHTLSKVETANNRRNKSFGQHYVGAGPAWPQNSLIWDHTLLLDLVGCRDERAGAWAGPSFADPWRAGGVQLNISPVLGTYDERTDNH